jgi:hypothetical protein
LKRFKLCLQPAARSGFLAGLAAVLATTWLGSARPNIGQNLELESLAATLLGGISIGGGSGSVLAPLGRRHQPRRWGLGAHSDMGVSNGLGRTPTINFGPAIPARRINPTSRCRSPTWSWRPR